MPFFPEQEAASGNKADHLVSNSWKFSTQGASDEKQLRPNHLTDGLMTSEKEAL